MIKLRELVNFSKSDKKEEQKDENREENVSRTAKIKVIVAVMVVGFAAYVAWWVQEPGSVRGADMVPQSETMETEQMTREVSFADFALEPAEIQVEKGTTIVWTNKDTVPHTVTGSVFTSGTLDRGQSYSYTFMEDGTYDYYCSYHPQITGKIIVGTGGETQEGTQLLSASEELMPEPIGDLFPAAPEMPATDAALFEDAAYAPDLSANATATEIFTPETGPQVLAAEGGETAEMHEAAAESDELASSGPEDILYVAAFAAILYLNRRRLAGAIK